jgi:hypothetical protein
MKKIEELVYPHGLVFAQDKKYLFLQLRRCRQLFYIIYEASDDTLNKLTEMELGLDDLLVIEKGFVREWIIVYDYHSITIFGGGLSFS